MNVQKYIEQKKNQQKILLEYFENSESIDNDSEEILKYITSQGIFQDFEELKLFLAMISNIAKNHYRQQGLIEKIEQILQHFSENIKQTLSNSLIFHIFENDKKILLFLFKQQIIPISEENIELILQKDENFYSFFLPEIESINKEAGQQIRSKLIEKDETILQNFEEKRQIGENDSCICTLIRHDSIDEFIKYIHQTNYDLSGKISSSIFETHYFLQNKKPTLIEYAMFFGSIKIFQYLKINNVDLNQSLWLYAIHSNDPEMINILIDNNVKSKKESYIDCFLESIMCHHFDISNFIYENLLIFSDQFADEKKKSIINKKINNCSLRSINFYYFPDNFEQNDAFYYLCKHKYNKIIKLYFDDKEADIETIIINTFYLDHV